MVNSNPETVSTDFDISDKLYFEPLSLEDVLEIVQREQPLGVIVQLGGQTPITLTRALERAGVTILGTSPDAIGDGTSYVIGGVMQHIEDAGIHSGDSACVLPPYIIREEDLATMRTHTLALAKALGVLGLINVQFAIRDRIVYVLEVNP